MDGRIQSVKTRVKPKHLKSRYNAYPDSESVGFYVPLSSHDRPPLFVSLDKSQLAKIKSLRRSSIGARGSPGTNALICFMAQQRAKTPPVLKTPEVRHHRRTE